MFDRRKYAIDLLKLGYVPLPIAPDTKACKLPGWQKLVPTIENIERTFARNPNLGIRLGDVQADGTCLIGIDIDLEEHSLVICVERAIGAKAVCKRGKKGFTYILRIDEQVATHKIYWRHDGQKSAAIDVLCKYAQTVIPPSEHVDTKRPYIWVGPPLEQFEYSQLPVINRWALDEINGYCKKSDDPIFALNDMEWRGVGGGGDTHDRCVAAVASMVVRGWPDDAIHERIERAKREACEQAGTGYDWRDSTKTIQQWIDSSRAKFSPSKGGAAKKAVHGVLADQFIERHARVIRYDRDRRMWYFFNGVLWLADNEFRVRDLVGQDFLADDLRSRGNIDGVVSSLRDRPELSMRQEDWDPDKHKLNTPGGTVDLRTGETSPHNPADLITRCTAVSPARIEDAPLWLQKLPEWFGSEAVEIKYHQVLAGYFLSGETRDPCLPVWLGPGGDGKSLIANLYAYLMHDYARTATDTAFLETRTAQHSEEIACLRTARLVLVAEAGGRWNEARVKAVTGGEKLSASFKFGSVFSFTPEFKLLVHTNEMPLMSSAGKAMERRIHVYPFRYPVADPDPLLGQLLRAQSAGILRWMIDGAVAYYSSGLFRSPTVEGANAEYLRENDIVQQFLDEYTHADPNGRVNGGVLYERFRGFLEQEGYSRPITRPTFTRKLKGKGIESRTAQLIPKSAPVRAYFGIRFREIDENGEEYRF